MGALRYNCLMLIAAGGTLWAQSYAVHLSRPFHSGESYTVSMTGSTRREMLSGDRIVKAEEYQVKFEGRADVVEVDAKGEPVRVVFAVAKFTKTEGGESVDLLKAGRVLVADSSEKEPISLKDGMLDEPVREAFSVLYTPHPRGSVTDDEIFGTSDARSIGDSWPMKAADGAKSLKEDTGISVAPEHFSGTTLLVGKDKVASHSCLAFRGEIKADDFHGDGPGGTELDGGSMHGEFRKCIPVDTSDMTYSEGSDMNIEAQVKLGDGSRMNIKMSSKTDAFWVTSKN